MKSIFTAVFCISALIATAQVYVPEKLLKSVRRIVTDTTSGSSTLININHNDYIITAKHLFKKGTLNGDSVTIWLDNTRGLEQRRCKFFRHPDNKIDIAILSLGTNTITKNGVDIMATEDSSEVFLTQDCFFLGFPLGYQIKDKNKTINDGYPIPFVKKGIIAGFSMDSEGIIYLDAQNNKGFSGGPAVTINQAGIVQLIGVVSGAIKEKSRGSDAGIAKIYSIKHLKAILEGI